MDAGNQLNKYLAINMKKRELKTSLKEDRYPTLIEQKIRKKRGMLEKKDVIINMLNKIEFLIRRKKKSTSKVLRHPSRNDRTADP